MIRIVTGDLGCLIGVFMPNFFDAMFHEKIPRANPDPGLRIVKYGFVLLPFQDFSSSFMTKVLRINVLDAF